MESGSKKTGLKILLGLLALVVVLTISAVVIASKKLTPEQVRTIVIEQIEKALPGASVSLGKIDYSLGTSIQFDLNNLDIKLKKKTKTDLLSLQQAQLKVPILAILLNGGTVSLSVNRPKVKYQEFRKSNNWELATKGPVKSSKKKTTKTQRKKSKNKTNTGKKETGSGEQDKKLPEFLVKSKINIALNEIELDYRLKDKTKGNLVVDRFLIKDLNRASSTAFEVASKFSQKAGGKSISLEALLIGQVELHEFLKTGVLKLSSLLKIKNLSVEGVLNNFPTINTNIKLTLNKDKSATVQSSVDIP